MSEVKFWEFGKHIVIEKYGLKSLIHFGIAYSWLGGYLCISFLDWELRIC